MAFTIKNFREQLEQSGPRRTERLPVVSDPNNCPYCDHPALDHTVQCCWSHYDIECHKCNCQFTDDEPQFEEIDALRWPHE